MPNVFLTLREVAERTRLSESSIRAAISEARGPAATRLSSDRGKMVISEDALNAWIASRTIAAVSA